MFFSHPDLEEMDASVNKEIIFAKQRDTQKQKNAPLECSFQGRFCMEKNGIICYNN